MSKIASIAFAYAALAWVSFRIAINSAVVPIRPPATLLYLTARHGYVAIIGCVLGGFAANALVLGPYAAVLIAPGHAIQAGLCVAARRHDMMVDIVFCTLGAMLSALCGVCALAITGMLTSHEGVVWVTWATGDLLGLMCGLAWRHGRGETQ